MPLPDTARSPSPMALDTQVNAKFWASELKEVTTLPLPRRGSGRPPVRSSGI